MDYFRVEGAQPLAGDIAPMGNKNSALPLLAASLLTDDPLTIGNVPDIGDVRTKLSLLAGLGIDGRFESNTCTLHAARVRDEQPDPGLSSRIRTAVLLAAPMLARFGRVKIFRPGGDRIGRRRLDTHLLALQALGAEIDIEPGHYVLRTRGLKGCDLFLDEMSVTGTEQALLAAVLADGTTYISNAAMEPHVQDVCRCLNAMGAKISGIGTHDLTVEGVGALHGARFDIGPDYMEVGSLIGLAAATGSDVRLVGAAPKDHRMTRIMYGRLGIAWEDDGDDIVVPASQEMTVMPDFDGAVPKIDDMPWPGFPPDLISIALVVATQCRGTVLIHQKMFDRRLVFVDRLIDMGAGIVLCDPHRALVMGPTRLHGERLVSPDIRAGMALVIAALCAGGTSTIHNVDQIDRGYERLDVRLGKLGARIERLSE
ncbi:MAG: UDP-N-acetylglucosamine 1-carboxyvinyltransferase [Gammaproteobacteria bacterium]|nr:UDP-N-acetylglucosamine 1-carboxyvinyltransferase [Gammaproteobacteria bacterium]MXY56529.1 UDP-N-acetylglucosamine 1-carboxyvinyltransferase [Gammaproteobacteria bacterium]MYF27418.1 UDP-N-acetylglucosamine 1-carboxyvinyltransferase [Gammaproteobacteria bacterium]MYK48616.1 UDP-N-acetylglucosamine 1-carboxyvinyltransferase [Gammaproteobacteria bacterium]